LRSASHRSLRTVAARPLRVVGGAGSSKWPPAGCSAIISLRVANSSVIIHPDRICWLPVKRRPPVKFLRVALVAKPAALYEPAPCFMASWPCLIADQRRHSARIAFRSVDDRLSPASPARGKFRGQPTAVEPFFGAANDESTFRLRVIFVGNAQQIKRFHAEPGKSF
jgi:hypothetical protein